MITPAAKILPQRRSQRPGVRWQMGRVTSQRQLHDLAQAGERHAALNQQLVYIVPVEDLLSHRAGRECRQRYSPSSRNLLPQHKQNLATEQVKRIAIGRFDEIKIHYCYVVNDSAAYAPQRLIVGWSQVNTVMWQGSRNRIKPLRIVLYQQDPRHSLSNGPRRRIDQMRSEEHTS